MLSSRTNRLCSQTNLPQKSPLASNPTSERLWCCHLVGSPSKKTERSQRKGERRERREGEKEKQRICHDWSDACEEETPQPSWCVTPIWRRAGSNSISKLDVFNRMQGMEGDDNFLSPTYMHTLSPLLGEKRRSQSLPGHQSPPSRLPTSDLSRQPPLVPEHDELWDSGGVTPSSGPPHSPSPPSTPHSLSPPLGFAPGSRSSETLLQTTKASPNKKKKERSLFFVRLF